jgi:orotate phosphoribosyltransferase
MTFEKVKQNYIDQLLAAKALLVRSIDEEPFTLRSGRKSCMFFDHSILATRPEGFRAFIDVIMALVLDTFGEQKIVLCNVDSKISAQMVGAVAYNLKLPQIIYKSSSLVAVEKGPSRQMTGDTHWNLPVAILDDVMTGGDGTAKGVGDLVKEAFPKIGDIHIFVGFTRVVKPSTYPSHHVITQNELLNQAWDTLTKGQQRAIEKERQS